MYLCKLGRRAVSHDIQCLSDIIVHLDVCRKICHPVKGECVPRVDVRVGVCLRGRQIAAADREVIYSGICHIGEQTCKSLLGVTVVGKGGIAEDGNA